MSPNINITHPKCSNCKCSLTLTIKSSGLAFKTCDKCRTKDEESRAKYKCEHDQRKDLCRDCDGASFCSHYKIKSRCKGCKGVSICIHNQHK